MIPKHLTADFKNRLKTVCGQLNGILRMMDDQETPEMLLLQLKAAEKGLENARLHLVEEIFRKTLALKIVHANNECPGNCGNEEKIEALLEQFPQFNQRELSKKMNEIDEIESAIKMFKNENK